MVSLLKSVINNVLRKPKTRCYPVERRAPFAGSRGHVEMDPSTCTFCGVCARKCPANALTVSKDPRSWTLEPYKCIVCGYCADICPKKSISMNPNHGLPGGI
jgi:formate hydrogenlyase subunit 6/NADH:ubiquinone oxidoreductase subunit I